MLICFYPKSTDEQQRSTRLIQLARTHHETRRMSAHSLKVRALQRKTRSERVYVLADWCGWLRERRCSYGSWTFAVAKTGGVRVCVGRQCDAKMRIGVFRSGVDRGELDWSEHNGIYSGIMSEAEGADCWRVAVHAVCSWGRRLRTSNAYKWQMAREKFQKWA